MVNGESPADVRSFIGEFSEVLDSREVTISSDDAGNNAVRFTGGFDGRASVHASNVSRGWWGVAENVLDRMRGADEKWALVLLHRSNHRGFVIPHELVEKKIRGDDWPVQEKGGRHFKIYPPDGVAGGFEFRSLEELAGVLQVLYWKID